MEAKNIELCWKWIPRGDATEHYITLTNLHKDTWHQQAVMIEEVLLHQSKMCLQDKMWLFIAALIKALKVWNSPPDSQTISCGKQILSFHLYQMKTVEHIKQILMKSELRFFEWSTSTSLTHTSCTVGKKSKRFLRCICKIVNTHSLCKQSQHQMSLPFMS
jgi:hypothetical protein